MLDNILDFIAGEIGKTAGVQYKTITKHMNIKQGVNDLDILDIDPKNIISITGSVHYSNYVLPLSYPMLNYGAGSYIEWGLSAITVGKSLKLISGAAWTNCDVKVVITYMGGVKRSKFKACKLFQRFLKRGGAR